MSARNQTPEVHPETLVYILKLLIQLVSLGTIKPKDLERIGTAFGKEFKEPLDMIGQSLETDISPPKKKKKKKDKKKKARPQVKRNGEPIKIKPVQQEKVLIPATAQAEANPDKAVLTECGSGRTRGCGIEFYRVVGEGKRCPSCLKTPRKERVRTTAQPISTQSDEIEKAKAVLARANQEAKRAAKAAKKAEKKAKKKAKGKPIGKAVRPHGLGLRECDECGSEFEPNVGHQKLCGDPACKKERNRKRVAAYRARQAAETALTMIPMGAAMLLGLA